MPRTPAKRTGPRGRSTARTSPRAEAATRDRILDAALHAFASHGFDGAKTRAIAAAAGVNQGLITYHFSSKEALWRAAVEMIFAQLQQSLGDRVVALRDVPPLARLRATVKHFVRFSAAHPELHRIMVQEATRDTPRMRWLVDRHIRPIFEGSAALIRRAQSDGLAQRVDAALLHYMMIGAATHIFLVAPEYERLTGRNPSERAVVEALAEAVASALLGPTPSTSPKRAATRRR